MSATATQTAAERYREIRAQQEYHLNQADAWGERTPEGQQHLAAFDQLQAEKESLKAQAATRVIANPERTAVHEASHAVACKSCGYRATSLTIVPTIDADGSCGLPKDIDGYSMAIVALAGRLGEDAICGFAAARDGTEDGDMEIVRGCVGYMWNLRDEVKAKAKLCVERNARAIQGLANVLLDRKTLTGAEVQSVLAQYWIN